MSNFLAIATVTATLQGILQTPVGNDVAGADVTLGRPDTPGDGKPRVNLYLYQVTPNAALRNTDLPTRNSAGQLVGRPHVALDLHYLVTFYGNEDQFEPQRLLGSVVRTFQTTPVLTRTSIRSAITSHIPILGLSNLADEVELVKFTPVAHSLEELSKLWSVFFQTPYVLSVAYQGSFILIESEESRQTPLPVRERNLYVAPFRQPVIEEIRSQTGPNQPIVVDDTLVIQGQRLSGDITHIRIGDGDLIMPTSVSDTEISLTLAEPPLMAGTLRAGVQGVQVVHSMMLGTPQTPHRGVESNVTPFVLHPAITVVAASTSGAGDLRKTEVIVTLSPPVQTGQRVVLLLNRVGTVPANEPRAYSFSAKSPSSSNSITFSGLKGVNVAVYLVRVQVDGAESPLGVDAVGAYDFPKVTIP